MERAMAVLIMSLLCVVLFLVGLHTGKNALGRWVGADRKRNPAGFWLIQGLIGFWVVAGLSWSIAALLGVTSI